MSITVHMSVDPPGLRGLNRLVRRLNDLSESGRIAPWQLGRRLVGTRDQYAIEFETVADARAAQEGQPTRGFLC